MERTYTVPLRKEWLKAPKYKRAKKAMTALRQFLVRHMKSEDVKMLPELNQEVWKDGIKSPPPRVKINVKKDDKGVVTAQLFGKNFPVVEEPKKGKAVKKEVPKVEEKAVEKKESVEKKVEEKAPATEKKTEEKVEAKKPVAEKKPEVKKEAEKKAEPAEEKKEVKAEPKAKPEKAEKPKAE